jgi:hypothetical protein
MLHDIRSLVDERLRATGLGVCWGLLRLALLLWAILPAEAIGILLQRRENCSRGT